MNLLLELAYDSAQTLHKPRKWNCSWLRGSTFLNFGLVSSRTTKNRLISGFSLFKSDLLLGLISECSINWTKEGKIYLGDLRGSRFFIFFRWILENRLLVNRKWKSQIKCSAIKLKITWNWSLGDGEKKICLQLFEFFIGYCFLSIP